MLQEYHIKVIFPDDNRQSYIITRSSDNLYDLMMQCEDDFELFKNTAREELLIKYAATFIKIKCFDQDIIKFHINEIAALNILKNTNLAPNIICHGQLFHCEVRTIDCDDIVDIWTCKYIVMSDCGRSLSEIYLPLGIREDYERPGTAITDNFDDVVPNIEDLFPVKYIPEHVTDRVIDILFILQYKYNILHEDVHPGNVLIDDQEIVRVIDFEYISIIYS